MKKMLKSAEEKRKKYTEWMNEWKKKKETHRKNRVRNILPLEFNSLNRVN